MSGWSGEFLGFTYDERHSSQLGIVRTSDGSRFNENLLPTQNNRTVAVPGRDETYFFGSDSTQKQFNISFTFERISDLKLEYLREFFGKKEVRPLRFDERGNITWMAKVTASSLKYVPFAANADGSGLCYSGEGTVTFTCYQPFGEEIFVKELKKTAGQEAIGFTKKSNSGLQWTASINGFIEKIAIGSNTIYFDYAGMKSYAKTGGSSDVGIFIDSNSGLVCGIDSEGNKTQKIYNQFITGGTFTKIYENFQIFWPLSDKNIARTATVTYKVLHY